MGDFVIDYEFNGEIQTLIVSDTPHGEVLRLTRAADGKFTADYDIELSFADEVYNVCVTALNAVTSEKATNETKYLPGSRSLQKTVKQDLHKDEFLAQVEAIFKQKA